VLFAGQIREDKGLDVLVRAAALAVQPLAVAVVGEDVGALARARQLAAELGVELVVDEGFQPLDRFVAALAAADVVVCPYRVSSMSAVATMARALGRPTVVTDAGGLPEVGTAVVPPDDPAALAEAVDCALKDAAVLVPDLTPPDVRPFLRPFGLVTAAPQP
jgi:glycosyltransferase involved in cell wall biosynthesis